MAILAVAVLCLAPTACLVDGTINHDGDSNVFEVSTKENYEIVKSLAEGQTGDIKFEAKVVDKSGNTQSSAVTPSSGTLDSGETKTLTVTVPKTAGTYTLEVKYTLEGEDDNTTDLGTDKETFIAVNPIVLKVNLKAKEVNLGLEEFGVYFYIDGEKMEDSYTTINLASNGTGSVSYNWIANPERNSTHTFYVEAVGGSDLVEGLGEEYTFYANDNDYSLVIALAFILLIVLIIALVWVYRKPVKNFGKPKSRR
jgi:hypothetical protein